MPRPYSSTTTGSGAPVQYVVGIDVGSETCFVSILRPDKTTVRSPFAIANAAPDFARLAAVLAQLDCAPAQIRVGLEATGRYWENLYQFLLALGYDMVLVHPGQTHHFAQQRGLRAKTDKLDAGTVARALLSDELRPAYVPSDVIGAYRELVRLQSTLTDAAARHKQEIRDLLIVLFPEVTQVFKDPTGPTALALLRAYPGAVTIATVGIEGIAQLLQDVAPQKYGRQTAERLVALAQQSSASPIAIAARGRCLQILIDQVRQTQANLDELEREIAALLARDTGVGSLQSVPEFGPTTVAMLRAELGEVARFRGSAQVVAYAGMDVTVRESGKWKGQRKLSKRGSGALRRCLFLAALGSLRTRTGSAFGAYYRALEARGLRGYRALVAVMRKMLVVAYHLLKSGERYDPAKVWRGAVAVAPSA
jgi:transposase